MDDGVEEGEGVEGFWWGQGCRGWGREGEEFVAELGLDGGMGGEGVEGVG